MKIRSIHTFAVSFIYKDKEYPIIIEMENDYVDGYNEVYFKIENAEKNSDNENDKVLSFIEEHEQKIIDMLVEDFELKEINAKELT